MELEQQYNRIKTQLRFENENDTESKFPIYISVNVSSLIVKFLYMYQFYVKR